MQRQLVDDCWKFRYAPSGDWTVRGACPEAEEISLPHDFRLGLTRRADTAAGGSEGYFPGGVGYYEAELTADAAMLKQRALLNFDGVYRMAEVRLNGDLLCIHHSGYTPFWVDLTGKLRQGDNRLLVTVRGDVLPGARWYPGAGIYRDVTLHWGPADGCIDPTSLHLKTPRVSAASSLVQLEADVRAKAGDQLRCRVYSPDGALAQEAQLALSGDGRITLEMNLQNCQLWSADAPRLYTLAAALERKGETLDEETLRFGLREIRLTPGGLFINGQETLLRGGCVHHDHGILGVCAYRDAEERKIRLLKSAGFNAVRCSHNPPSAHFLNLCDELGLYVIDEIFDCWREGKKALDDHIFFEADWQEDVRATLLRDRNHPSVLMWSTGNEVYERGGASEGAAWSRRIAQAVRALDASRPITNALCHFSADETLDEMTLNGIRVSEDGKDWFLRGSEDFVAPLDVVGYNYMEHRYEKDHQFYPRRIFCGTESLPKQALESWRRVEELPYVIGDFCWTAMDYLGEAGIGCAVYEGPARGLQPFPALTANCGDLDLCGMKRPQSYFRDLVWHRSQQPYLWVQPPEHYGRQENTSSWGWPDGIADWDFPGQEGRRALIRVYAAGDRVELYLNGQLQAMGTPEGYMLNLSLPYQPGELCAIAYAGERELGRCALKTPGAPAAIRLLADKAALPASKYSLGYVLAEIVDEDGNLVRRLPQRLSFSLSGPGSIIACGSADPFNAENYTQPWGSTWQGRLMVVCRASGAKGRITLRASCPGLDEKEICWLCG